MSGPSRLRIEPGDASESWKRSEGRTVDGKFPLLTYLAGFDNSAVFRTSFEVGGNSQDAAIKLIYASAADAEKQLQRWTSARGLDHPNLIRIFASGRCEIGGTQLLYVVQEYAEENLAQILPERALTREEAREMLPPLLEALQYLHEKGFAHGHIQPSNILAIGDRVKLSSDTLIGLGEKSRRTNAASVYDPPEAESDTISPAADVWRLGVTLMEVLTQHLPECDHDRSRSPEIPRSMPEPFGDIARHCLQAEPDRRWTIAEIQRCFAPEQPVGKGFESPRTGLVLVPAETSKNEKGQSGKVTSAPLAPGRQKPSPYWLYLLALGALAALAIILIFKAKSGVPSSAGPPSTLQPKQQPSESDRSPSKSNAIAASGDAAQRDAATSDGQDGVLHRVVPDVSSSARRTIHGRIVIRVKVKVDAAGDVTKAILQSSHASKYFSRAALDAAREWKFLPERTAGQSAGREWNLQFAFTRAKTDVSATAINR